ncbi:MAG: FtsX-like permease family protein [Acidimicrobiia bacterium]
MTAPVSTRRPTERPSATVGARAILRQLTAEPVVPVVIMAVVLVTGFFLTAAPRMFRTLSGDALQDTLARTSAPAGNLAVQVFDRIGAASGDNPFVRIEEAGQAFVEENVGEPVRSLIEETRFEVESINFQMLPFPGDTPTTYQTFMHLRYMEDIADHVRLVEGRFPQPQPAIQMWVGFECPEIEIGDDPDAIDPETLVDPNGDGFVTCARLPVEVFEAAFTRAALDQMGLDIGDRVVLEPDDPRFSPDWENIDFRFGVSFARVIEVSGVFEANDPDEAYWYDDPTLLTPSLGINPDFVIVYPIGLFAPEDYARLVDNLDFSAWTYTQRHFLDHSLITVENAPEIATEVRRLQTDFRTTSIFSFTPVVGTGLAVIIDDYLAQRDLAISVLSISVAGVFVVALALVWLLAALMASSQRGSTIQLRSRGGSPGQLTFSQLIQGLILSVPAAALAYGASRALIPGANRVSLMIAAALAAGAALLLIVASSAATRRNLGLLHRTEDDTRRASLGRLVAEALVVVLAGAAIIVIRRRPSTPEDGLDLLMAAGPVLLALAVAVVTLRLYVLPIRLAAWLGSRRKGLVGFVGFQRVVQQAPAARLPLTVILLAVAVAVFADLVGTSINQGQIEATYHTVGASYRVTGAAPGRPLSPDLDLSGLPEVEATALATLLPASRLRFEDVETRDLVDVLAIDAADYQTVVSGTAADPRIPTSLTDPDLGEGVGTRDNPMAAIVSSNWSATRPPALGQIFSLEMGGVRAVALVTEIREVFPGFPEGRPFVVLPRPALEIAAAPEKVTPTILYARAPRSALGAIETTLEEQTLGMSLTAQASLFDQIHDSPLVTTVDLALRLAFIVALVFAVVAAVAGVALLAGPRDRDFGYMGTMGLSHRQTVAMTLIEQVPAALIAAVVGGLLGIGISLLLRPVIDLGTFVGPGLTITLDANPLMVVWISLGVVTVLVGVILLYGPANRRRDLGSVVRLGDE